MKGVIGIRKETKDVTERRAPLTPHQVKQLIESHGVHVVVEPAENRLFRESEYQAVGAEISTDLTKCNIIFGVKEIPVPDLRPRQVYCFFSHTIKGQPYNMPMLKRILEFEDTLLDYELVVDKQGKRLIYFSDFAGYAGMIDTLWVLGQRLLWEGIDTPFRHIRQAIEYGSLEAARKAIRQVARQISREGFPPAIVPLVVGFTGRGHVSQGAQSIFDLLPHQEISPEDLPGFLEKGMFSRHCLYKVRFLKEHLYEPIDPNLPFDATQLMAHPEQYCSRFERFVPYLTVLVNGIYWEPRFPHILTRSFLRELFQQASPRLRVIGDITCDVDGSLETTVKATNSLNPVYVYDPVQDTVRDGFEGRGVVVLAVDKLPTELPREASESFGEALLPFVPQLAVTDFSRPYSQLDLPLPFQKAVIAHQGKLTPDFQYLKKYLDRIEETSE
ncbi:MAG: hypothetical protein GXO78_10840 [Calditrichaeota bacterium]|nr:hypothetical protein [Calditrichota bacterium]